MESIEIIDRIAKSKKKTPVKVYLSGNLKEIIIPSDCEFIGDEKFGVFFGELESFNYFMSDNRRKNKIVQIRK